MNEPFFTCSKQVQSPVGQQDCVKESRVRAAPLKIRTGQVIHPPTCQQWRKTSPWILLRQDQISICLPTQAAQHPAMTSANASRLRGSVGPMVSFFLVIFNRQPPAKALTKAKECVPRRVKSNKSAQTIGQPSKLSCNS